MKVYYPIAKFTVPSGSDQTLISVAAHANGKLKVLELMLTFYGTDTVQAPIQLQFGVASASGVFTAVTGQHSNDREKAVAISSTAGEQHSVNATMSDKQGEVGVHPQSGLLKPFLHPIELGPAGIFTVLCKDPGTSTAVSGYILVEE